MNSSSKKRWKRPDGVTSFPHVWSTFTVTRDDRTFNVRIQDATPDQFDEIWDMFKDHFYLDEEVIKTANQIEDEVTMSSQTYSYNEYVKENMSIIAVIDNGDREPIMVAALILKVATKDDPPSSALPGVARAKLQNLFKILCQGIDEFEKLNIDKCLKDYAIVVKREYRRLYIGNELFLAMEKMAKMFDIPAAVVIFNNSVSQALAAKLGYSVLSEVNLEDYKDENGQVIIPAPHTKVVQLCYKYFR